MDTLTNILEKEQKEFLNFLKSRSMLYHLSNVFFRDIHYGVMAYLEMKNIRYKYTEAEKATTALIEEFERQDILRRLDRQTFMLNYPAFKKPAVKPAAPAKPAAAAKPAPPKPPAAAAAQPPKPNPVGESAEA